MVKANMNVDKRFERSLSVVNRTIDVVFNRAPVMMHSVNEQGKLVAVNPRWLQTLGYSKREVLGRASTDFLTLESSLYSRTDALPLFWRVGSARNIGLQFAKKNGKILDVLLDADACSPTELGNSSVAAVRKGHDSVQWEQAKDTLSVLRELTHVRKGLQNMAPIRESGDSDTALKLAESSSHPVPLEVTAAEAIGGLLEIAKDVSSSLIGLLRLQEESIEASVVHQNEILQVAKNIDRTLTDLANEWTRP